MVTNRINEGPKPIRLSEAFFCAHQCQHAHEGFLPDIFYGFFRSQSRAQLETYQFAEVAHEMPFDVRVPGSKFLDVRRIKRKEFQSRFLHGDSERVQVYTA